MILNVEEMKSLPEAPNSLTHGEVSLVFDRMTDGDETRGFVPGYHFKIFNNKAVEVGHLNFRIGDTAHVKYAAGHIGYEVAENFRGHGYAADACFALAPWIAQISPEVLITVDPSNTPSIRTIERIGASFIDEVDVPEGDPHFLRGSFRKRRYRWNPTEREPQR